MIYLRVQYKKKTKKMYIYLTSDIVPGGKRGELLHRMTAGIGSNSEEKLQKTND